MGGRAMGGTAEVRKMAADLRAQAVRERKPPEWLVQTIAQRCGVSLLAAHRLARGWSQPEAVHELNAQRDGDRAITPTMLSGWETGRTEPKASSLDLLCKVYETRLDQLGFCGNYDTGARPDDLLCEHRAPPRRVGTQRN
jgi:transcriptional regulator with XRE-family HTH domain